MPLPHADLDTTTVEVPLRLLKMLEWQYNTTCPICHEPQKHGHAHDCELGMIIADVTVDVRIQKS